MNPGSSLMPPSQTDLTASLSRMTALLIVAGFSFGDEHINNLVFGALENRPRTHVYALQFDERPEDSDLVKRACQRPNMIVIGPRHRHHRRPPGGVGTGQEPFVHGWCL